MRHVIVKKNSQQTLVFGGWILSAALWDKPDGLAATVAIFNCRETHLPQGQLSQIKEADAKRSKSDGWTYEIRSGDSLDELLGK